MMRTLGSALAACVLLASSSARANAQVVSRPPDSEIFLSRLFHTGDSLRLGPAENITGRPGYDNQPAFLTDATGLLYTAIDSTGQADIWRFDLRSRRRVRLTDTPESEYSPTMMPGSTRFSVVRVERDSTQRLWSFRLDGTDPQLVLESLAPIGYHAWLDQFRVAVYVLGTPSTLHVLRRDGSEDEVRANHIGRTIQRVPAQGWYSFVQLDSTHTPWIVAQPFEGGAVSRLVRLPGDNEFYTWGPDGTLLSATGGSIVRWNGVSGEGSAWLPVVTAQPLAVKSISRLAVSPDGRWLAFVADPGAP
jgi:Tol biopolymer transport system component